MRGVTHEKELFTFLAEQFAIETSSTRALCRLVGGLPQPTTSNSFLQDHRDAVELQYLECAENSVQG